MSREIKFRAWHKEWSPKKVDKSDWHNPGQKINGMQFVTGIWISNSGIKWVDMYPIDDPFVEFNKQDRVSLEDFKSTVRLDEVELMQFTGLKDKNGVEIYEGDILVTKHKTEPKKIFWEVVWAENEDGYMWGWMVKSSRLYILDRGIQEKGEVVGNIYSDPHLIEGESK